MPSHVSEVAIIGSGPGGAALAIALKQRNVPVRIYELRAKDSPIMGGAVVIHPNGAQLLEKLGIWEETQSKSYHLTSMSYTNDKDETTAVDALGSKEVYGYENLRIYRHVLLGAMKAKLEALGVPIEYGARFNGIVEETAAGVRFRINDRVESASLLVGSDGIHSQVRKYITAEEPQYTGLLVVSAHVPYSDVAWPSPDYPRAVTLQGAPGGMFMLPQTPDGEDYFVGLETAYPAQTRAGWEALERDPDALNAIFQRDYARWFPTAQRVLDVVGQEKNRRSMTMWAHHRLADLDSWASPDFGRVVVVGDAAHAIPPSSGQGVNQAMEDSYTLAYLIAGADADKTNLLEMLAFWRAWRRTRIDWVKALALRNEGMRKTKEERERLAKEYRAAGQGVPTTAEEAQALIRKVYLPAFDGDMQAWLDEHN